MGLFGTLAALRGARHAAKQHPGKVHHGIDKVTSAVKSKLPAEHAGKVDKGAAMAKKALTGSERTGPDRT